MAPPSGRMVVRRPLGVAKGPDARVSSRVLPPDKRECVLLRDEYNDELHRRRRSLLQDQTINLWTQNVRGFGLETASTMAWLDVFAGRNGHGINDVVMLQETHVLDDERDVMARLHARSHGYVHRVTAPLSFWSGGASRAAGVAILVHPRSALTECRPAATDLWCTNFCAITARLGDKLLFIACVYGPRGKRQQTEL